MSIQSMRRFVGQSVVVTGAGSGFGAAIARRFFAEGASVLVVDVRPEQAETTVASLRAQANAEGRALACVANVSIAAQVHAAMATAEREFGGVNVLVNNAGIAHRSGPVWELEEADFDRVFAVNTKGVWLGVKYVVPLMQKQGGGVIINTASIGAVAPRPGMAVYNATKGAVMTMTRGLAVELARFKIRVNAVNPVAADTAFMREALGTDALPETNRAALVSGIPLRRLTEPEDVAGAVTFLASEDAKFLTGVCLPVDGGRSIS